MTRIDNLNSGGRHISSGILHQRMISILLPLLAALIGDSGHDAALIRRLKARDPHAMTL